MNPESFDYKVLLLAEDEILSAGDDLWWRCGPRARLAHGDVHWLVNCSDQFYWGTADAEQIVDDADLDAIRLAHGDLKRSDLAALGENKFSSVYAGALWVCRKRELRPQKPWVDRIKTEHTRDLFLQWPAEPHQGWPNCVQSACNRDQG